MSAIFEALMGNLVFVIIVIGIIASLFNKLKQAGNQESRMPDFSGGAAPKYSEEYPRSLDERESPLQDQQARGGTEPVYTFDEVMPVNRNLMEDASLPAYLHDRDIDRRPRVNRQQDEPGRLEAANPLVSADDLTRAVVWAEILGPPRAKRPYKVKR